MAYRSPLTALVVIDPAVADACKNDNHILLQTSLADAEVLLLDAHRDGVTQITEALATLTNLERLHLVAASSDGLQLGSTKLTLFNLERYGWQLQQWGESFAPHAQMPVYGYQEADPTLIASLSAPFLNRLCLLTGAKVTLLDCRGDRVTQIDRASDNRSDSLLMG